jgi:hypothetical protein
MAFDFRTCKGIYWHMKEEQLKAFEEKLYNAIIKSNAEYSSDIYQKWEIARNIMQRRNIDTPNRNLRYIFY